ncbi:TonB-dependent receptor [Tunturiibacter lichenicola]|uniref:TonB-dependent receptor n=1 Tax=Tunturiibacter lichenicola TaxID=2051959 RepID=UPI0021B3F198|nr:carboxypeptidase regulatory-like domain-containing protein [Edaphobacter lichenicola]
MLKSLGFALVLLATSLFSYGQATSVNGGSIQGSITDPSGAVVAGASVTVLDTDTGSSKTVITDKAGFYSVGPLNPGSYTVTVVGSGFEHLSVKTVVRTGTATSGSFKLTLGSSAETVEVNAGALQINTDQIGVAGVITREQIDSLPVNGRDILDYAQLEPGVILQSGQSFDPTKAGYSAISVSGVGGRTTRILLDGQDITDETVGTTIYNVPAGAIQEFQLNRSTQDVSGSVTSTGQVLVSTQSGTNSFHGNLFYNFQDARAGAAEVGGLQAPFQRNQFGGYFGGPIIKDKLFFYGGAERIKQSEQDVALGASPEFSAILQEFPFVPAPFTDTFSYARLDYDGPKGIHFFARGVYSVNSDLATFGLAPYQLYKNRDNVPGLVGGADFTTGHFTHSFRGGYEKFHNLLEDGTGGLSSIYNPSGPALGGNVTLTGSLNAGPNYLAPQETFQTDKQFRYDGSWTKGAHTVKFGFDMNRLASGGNAEFFGASLFTSLQATPSNLPAGLDPTNPLNYVAQYYYIGNGNSLFSERPGFGLAGGLSPSWRFGSYVADTWKTAPYLTLTAGLRWSVDTDRANQDLPTPLCSSVDPSLQFSGCTGNTPLFDQYQAGLGVRTHQPYANFGPQAGFNFSPGDHKTSLRGGIGIFYESSVFNNTGNARTEVVNSNFPSQNQAFAPQGASSITLPGFGVVTSSPDGTPVSQILNEPIGQAAFELNAIKAEYQAKVANVAGPNPSYIGTGNGLYANSIYAGPYKSPYSIQFNGGIQRELAKGLILSADYVHNATLKIPITQDVNHNGAARTLNTAAAANAIANTLTACGAPSISAAVAPGGCPGLHPATPTSPVGPAQITDFASNGLDSGAAYLSGTAASNAGLTPATGAAFPGTNPNVGSGKFILPIGRSGYDALQVVLQQQKAHPAPGIVSSNFQVSYSLSRIVSGNNGDNPADQFFAGALAYDNDDPNRYLGRTPLDHSNELSFGGSLGIKYGLQLAMIGHFFSASASSLTLDALSGATGQIFQTDVDGDGTTGDLVPGTIPGAYEHEIKGGKGLNTLINTYNATHAGTPTPAGQALIAAGLFTPGQLLAANGVQQPIASAPSNPLNNAALRTFDLSASYPIRFNRFHEGLSIVPGVAMYNVFNMSNFGFIPGIVSSATGTLLNQADAGQPGYYNGTSDQGTLNQARTTRNSGTFDQGGPRTTEFQLKLNF